jgi:hypothetical protein
MVVYDVNCRLSLDPLRSKKPLKEHLLDALLGVMENPHVRAFELKSIGEPIVGKDGTYTGSKIIWEADPYLVVQPF